MVNSANRNELSAVEQVRNHRGLGRKVKGQWRHRAVFLVVEVEVLSIMGLPASCRSAEWQGLMICQQARKTSVAVLQAGLI